MLMQPRPCAEVVGPLRPRVREGREVTSGPYASRLGSWAAVDNMQRLEEVVGRLPEAVRVDIEEWGGEPTFRVRGKNFIFTNQEATGVSVKLPKEEAAAVVATDPRAEPTGYGLGRHGWVSVTIDDDSDWRQLEEWVRTSYTLVAPKKLARIVLEEDGTGGA
jgi:predicted DNA-binding protein (MmcQ/YjbR family)